MNITAGFCSCWDWDACRVCAHLLAALQHPQFGPLCTFDLQLPQSATDAIPVERPRPLPLADGVEEPLVAVGEAALGGILLQLAAATKAHGDIHQQQQEQHLQQQQSETRKAWQRDVCHLACDVKHLTDEQLQTLKPQLSALSQAVSNLQPAFVPLTSSSRQVTRRDSDRTTKPLYSGRKRGRQQREEAALLPAVDAGHLHVPGGRLLNTIGQQDAGAEQPVPAQQPEQFAPLADGGRKREKTRGRGNYVRSQTKGYLRPKRTAKKPQAKVNNSARQQSQNQCS